MFVSSIRKWLRNDSAPATRRSARTRLLLETLEDRAVPATFTVGTGSGEFATIQSALDAAKNSSGADTVQVKAGTYNEALIIDDSSPVTLKRFGSDVVTVKAPASLTSVTLGSDNVGAALIDIYSTKVTVEGLTVDGANAPGNLSAGIRVIKGGSATIKNNTVTNLNTSSDSAFGIGIQVGSNRGGGSTGTAKVDNNTINNYLGAGVIVDGATSSARVKSNTITGRGLGNNGIAQYGVQVSRGASARVESNTISGNDIDGAVSGGSNPAVTSAGVYVFDVDNDTVVVAKNTTSGNDIGIFVEGSTSSTAGSIRIVNNTVTANNGYGGIVLQLSTRVDVKNNEVFSNTAWNGIALDEAHNNDIRHNDIYNNANADGIYLFASNCNDIKTNDSFCNGLNGILLESSSNNWVWNNDTYTNGANGIKVLGGGTNDIWLGDSSSNAGDGILLQDTVCNTIILNNLVCNAGYGVRLLNADNTYIALNNIQNNGLGSIFTDANSTGTVNVANRTDTPPVEEGTAGATGTSTAYSTATAAADTDVSTLDD